MNELSDNDLTEALPQTILFPDSHSKIGVEDKFRGNGNVVRLSTNFLIVSWASQRIYSSQGARLGRHVM